MVFCQIKPFSNLIYNSELRFGYQYLFLSNILYSLYIKALNALFF